MMRGNRTVKLIDYKRSISSRVSTRSVVITGVAALFMVIAGFTSDNGAVKVSGMWLMGFYAIITVGELFLSPMALSLVPKLSPTRFVGLTMGGWFFATAVGNKPASAGGGSFGPGSCTGGGARCTE